MLLIPKHPPVSGLNRRQMLFKGKDPQQLVSRYLGIDSSSVYQVVDKNDRQSQNVNLCKSYHHFIVLTRQHHAFLAQIGSDRCQFEPFQPRLLIGWGLCLRLAFLPPLGLLALEHNEV